jgi:hypothetical protein
MGNVVSLNELDEIFQKYEGLRKHIIAPTKDFLDELWAWKTKFNNSIRNSKEIPYPVKCRLLGEKNILER